VDQINVLFSRVLMNWMNVVDDEIAEDGFM